MCLVRCALQSRESYIQAWLSTLSVVGACCSNHSSLMRRLARAMPLQAVDELSSALEVTQRLHDGLIMSEPWDGKVLRQPGHNKGDVEVCAACGV
jgi:hypothetical protein